MKPWILKRVGYNGALLELDDKDIDTLIRALSIADDEYGYRTLKEYGPDTLAIKTVELLASIKKLKDSGSK